MNPYYNQAYTREEVISFHRSHKPVTYLLGRR